jgi:hypothetical protein
MTKATIREIAIDAGGPVSASWRAEELADGCS